jgi:16S rRNA C1402 N4-methylase RsmH
MRSAGEGVVFSLGRAAAAAAAALERVKEESARISSDREKTAISRGKKSIKAAKARESLSSASFEKARAKTRRK